MAEEKVLHEARKILDLAYPQQVSATAFFWQHQRANETTVVTQAGKALKSLLQTATETVMKVIVSLLGLFALL